MWFTCKAENVRMAFLNAAESFCCSRNTLVNDDSLHFWIVGKSYNLRNCCFLLRHKIIRICDVLNHSAVFNCAIALDKFFCTAEVIFGLRNSSCYNTDMEICSC